jgi:hypothetical protein
MEQHEWLDQRLKSRQQKIASARTEEQWRANARSSFASMFQALGSTIESYVHGYNAVFQEQLCKAQVIRTASGEIIVNCQELKLRVSKGEGTIISYSVGGTNDVPMPAHIGSLEVVSDSSGNIRFKDVAKNSADHLMDCDEASQLLLGKILCE